MKLPVLLLSLLLMGNYGIVEMSLEDDAFHSELPLHIETWYFEALFQNNESMVFMITVMKGREHGIMMTGVHLYKNGKIIYEGRKIFTSFFISDEIPFISTENETLMEGYIMKNHLCYNISYSSSFSFSLKFINTTMGWKATDEKWIAVPNMIVDGFISFNGNESKVRGKGYHDHNIFFLFSPFIKRGYMDGRVMMENVSIVWAKLMSNIFLQQNFVIVSTSSFQLIENADIECRDYEINNGRPIPTTFLIRASEGNVSLNITLHTSAIHFIRLPLLHYWRYHVHATGEIRMEGERKRVDTYDMMEYMLFT